jgi:hypothetical protein
MGLKKPGEQSVHAEPGRSAFLPMVILIYIYESNIYNKKHSVCYLLLDLPGTHDEQIICPNDVLFPATQFLLQKVDPTVSEYFPREQYSQREAPVVLEYVATGHGRHVPSPVAPIAAE